MAYKAIKVIDFVPQSNPHDDLMRAQARKIHYESELERIRCAELIQRHKDEGKPIQVQGNQND